MYSNNKIPQFSNNDNKKQPIYNSFPSFPSFPTPGAKMFINSDPCCPINEDFPSFPSYPTPGPSAPLCVDDYPFPSELFKDLSVVQNTTFGCNVQIGKKLNVCGDIDTKNLTVDNTGYFGNVETHNLTIYNSFNIPANKMTVSSVDVLNNVTVKNNLSVSGTFRANNINLSGADIIVRSATYTDNVTVYGCLTVSCLDVLHDIQLDSATFYQNVDIENCLNVGCLTVSNNLSLYGNLSVSQNAVFNSATFYGNLTVLGSFNFSGYDFEESSLAVSSLYVDNDAVVDGSLDVFASSTFSNKLSTSYLFVSNNTMIKGNLSVSGCISTNYIYGGGCGPLWLQQIFVSGGSTFTQRITTSGLYVSNNSVMRGSLSVSNNSTFGSNLSTSGLVVSNNIIVNGTLTINGNLNLPVNELTLDSTTTNISQPISGVYEYYVGSVSITSSYFSSTTFWQGLSSTGSGPIQTTNGHILNQHRIVLSGGSTYVYAIEQGNNSEVCGIWRWSEADLVWSVLGTMTSGGTSQLLRALVVSSNNVFVATDGLVQGCSGIIRYNINTNTWNQWASIPGSSNHVHCMEMDSNGDIYVGGTFNNINGVTANNIAKWNGITWNSLGNGVVSNVGGGAVAVRTIAFDNNENLYVAGNISLVNGVYSVIGKWNIQTSSWNNYPLGPFSHNTIIRSLAVDNFNGKLYIASNLFNGGIHSLNLYNNNYNSLQSSNSVDGYSVAVDKYGYLYLGGNFVDVNDPTTGTSVPSTNNIARFDPYLNKWSQVGGGITGASNIVYDINIDSNNNVLACGSFRDAGTTIGTLNIARYYNANYLTQASRPYKKIKFTNGQFVYRNYGSTEYGNTLTFYEIADTVSIVYNISKSLGFVQYITDDILITDE